MARVALALSRQSGQHRAATAAKVALTFSVRSGHVAIVAADGDAADAIFRLAEPQLPPTRVVRVAAGDLDPASLPRDVFLPLNGATHVALVVANAETMSAHALVRLGETIRRTPGICTVVRLVLLGTPRLAQTLNRPEARPFTTGVAVLGDVPAPDPIPVAADLGTTRWYRPPRRPRWLSREQGLTLAAGAALLAFALWVPMDFGGSPAPVAPIAAREPPPPVALPASEPSGPSADPETPLPGPAERDVVATGAAEISVAERPAEEPPAAERPAPRPAWRLQVGAFRDRANAIELASKVSEHFDGVHVTADAHGGAPLYRVRVDGLGSEADLRATVTALRAAGHESFRVP
jgi:hypothetical protein